MLEFNTTKELISLSDLQNLESALGAILPEDYKTHMLKYNGGRVSWTKSYILEYNGSEYELGGFKELDKVKEFFESKNPILYPKYFSIGDIEGGYLAMGYQEENYGQIFVYFSDEAPQKVANSFSEFLQSIKVVNEE
ncbi:SMI1/KNR4 family protein [Psychroserpens luteus]|uniref:SMI1/KNR4 family protein n=1 Tax=Psychroserpens luteus TaxID=1434066 RepID=A0ABW5ZY12_9FLAO|nr:SMI1/KNR4 family protein [Psychroserpens luteus]